MYNASALVDMCFPCARLQLTHALVPQRQKTLLAPFTAVKLKASHHKPCSFSNRRSISAERSNYYLLWSCYFHGLFCVLIPGQILSAAVPTLSEENRKNSATQQASAFCYYGYDSIIAGQRFTPAHWKRERNVLTPSLLMELKVKGVFVQRGDHQPLNVGSSSSKPHLTIHSPPAVLSKWPPLCACSRRSNTRGGGTSPPEICLSWCCSSHLLFSLASTRVEKFSMLQF